MKIFKIFLWSIIISLYSLLGYYYYPEPKLPNEARIDKILVIKNKRILIVYQGVNELKRYKISLGRQPVGKKEFEGDFKTPEGTYYINSKNIYSGYHKSLWISYPNKNEIQYARKFGKSAGGAILIHGINDDIEFIGKFHRFVDWTKGCIALTNKEIDELYIFVNVGTKIEIIP